MRLVHLLALRHARRRPLRTALTVLAVAAGTCLAMTVLVVRDSVDASVRAFAGHLSGPAALRVLGPVRRGGLGPDVAPAVSRVPGVAEAVPLVQAVTEVAPAAGAAASLTGSSVLVLGVDCRVEALVGPVGCSDAALAAAGDRPLAVGPGLRDAGAVRVHGGVLPLGDAAVADRLGRLGDGRVVVVGLPAAQRLYGRGDRVDVVYVRPAPGVDVAALRHRLAGVVGEQDAVLAGDAPPPEVGALLGAFLPLFTLIAVVSLVIGGLLVVNTAALSLEERRPDLAVVAALGGTPRTVVIAALGEAALVGLAGGLLGGLGGLVVARPIVAALSTFTEASAGVPVGVQPSWPLLAVAVALGALLSVGATALPVRRALRLDVAAELSGRSVRAAAAPSAALARSLRWLAVVVAGVAAVAVGTWQGGLSGWQPPLAAVGFALAAAGLLMLGSVAAAGRLKLLHRLGDRSAAARLALGNVANEPRRTAVMVIAVAAAMATAFVTAGYARGITAAAARGIGPHLDGVQVRVVDTSTSPDTAMSPRLLDVLSHVEGAGGLRRDGSVLVGSSPGDLIGVSAFQDPWLDQHPVRGRLDRRAFAEGRAIVNTGLARAEGLRPGDEVRLATPGGVVAIPVLAVVEGGGAAPRSVQLPLGLFERLYGRQPLTSVTVARAPGTTLDQLHDRVLRAVTSSGIPDPLVVVRDPDELIAEQSRLASTRLGPFWTLQRALVLVAFVSVLSTLLLVGIQRRRELGMLGAVGMEPAGLARMVLAEAAVVATMGIMVAVDGGLIMLWCVSRTAPLLIGFTTPLRPDFASLFVWGFASAVVTLAAALWPARQAARTRVVAALRAD